MHPPVFQWFRVYAWAMAALYVGTALLSLLFFSGFLLDEGDEPWEGWMIGTVLLGMSVVFCAAFVAGAVLKPRPWVWIYDMVLICVGLSSCLTMGASIPLLIFWLKPETKAHFGRQ
jgi:MFS family permease